MQIERTDSRHSDFIELVSFLDAELAERDGAEHAFYQQFNGMDSLKNCVIYYVNSQAVGCGAFKAFENDAVEIKRMFTLSDFRGKGIARAILSELEQWAHELGYSRAVLETGIRQPEAVGLYSSYGFKRISNFGQYKGVENSLCFEKSIK